MEKNDYITVSQLNRYLKYKIENDENLNIVYLKGEISNFKAHTRGHLYFTLKDEGSRLNAVMFSYHTGSLKFEPVDGMKVLVCGKIAVYEGVYLMVLGPSFETPAEVFIVASSLFINKN